MTTYCFIVYIFLNEEKKMNAIKANIHTSFSICMNNVQVVSSKRILWHINDCICKSLEIIALFLACKSLLCDSKYGLLKSLESLS